MTGRKNLKLTLSILLWFLLCFEDQEALTYGATAQENVQGNKLNGTSDAREKGQYQHYNHPSYNAAYDKHSHKTLFTGEQGYHYLLPEQTAFDSPEEVIASMVMSTSPPRLTIKPSPVQESIPFTNTVVHRKDASVSHSLQPEACISETPTFPFVASSFSLALQVQPNKAAMHGRIETASSTELANDIVENRREMSQPSTILLHDTNIKNIAESKT